MPLTLREAMNLVEPLKRSRVIAGDRGLDNIVQSVNVMEVPDILASTTQSIVEVVIAEIADVLSCAT